MHLNDKQEGKHLIDDQLQVHDLVAERAYHVYEPQIHKAHNHHAKQLI